MDALCSVCVADAIGEGVELVAGDGQREATGGRGQGVRTLADAS